MENQSTNHIELFDSTVVDSFDHSTAVGSLGHATAFDSLGQTTAVGPLGQTTAVGPLGQTTDEHVRCKGVIRKYIHKRNFGFIEPSNRNKNQSSQQQIFFHKNSILKSNFSPKIKEGDRCYYHLSKNNKGLVADNIVICYRPNSNKGEKIKNDPDMNKMRLFTETVLKLFEYTTRPKNK